MNTKVTTLNNGLRIATDYMDNVETVSVGAWVGVGARNEKAEFNGISHLLEHLAFKGTKKRSAFTIAEEIEAVGGQLNAYTSRESTAYYAKVLKEDTRLAVDIIADIIQNATIEVGELNKEKQVVIQEINQSEDTPDDIIFDHFQETAYPDQPIGRPVLGKVSLIKNWNRETILHYMSSQYSAPRTIIAAAGNVEHKSLVDLATNAFYNLNQNNNAINEPCIYKGGFYQENRDLEQVHFVIGFEGVSYKDNDYYPLLMLSTLLGGGMSSRLFQEVRERRGLAYSIYSFTSNFDDSGLLGIYAGTSINQTNEILEIIFSELFKISQKTRSDELTRARAQMKAQMLMGLESTVTRSEQIARQLQIFGRIIPVEEILQKIKQVDQHDIHRVICRMLKSKPTFAVIGPVKDSELYSYDIIKQQIK